jgi:Homeodomain-like domain
MSGLQVGVEVVPSRREWVRAAALFCNACTTGLAMGDPRRRHCADYDLGRLHWQPRGGHRLGRKVLAEVANVARPDRILAWYRKLVARKFDGSKARRSPGRPRIKREIEQLIVRMARENRDWGYDRIVGALVNLGYKVCDQTVGNVLHRHGLPPAPERKRTTTWPEFIRIHLARRC